MNKTKIIGTTGPSFNTKKLFKEGILAGLSCFRFNMSHAKHHEVEKYCQYIRELNDELGTNVSTLLDTKGPEIRALTQGKPVDLFIDDLVFIRCKGGSPPSEAKLIDCDYAEINEVVAVGSRVPLNSGFIETEVERVLDNGILCRVSINGRVKNNAHINLPGIKVGLPGLTTKDKEDVALALKLNIDFIAMSFVRKAEDINELKLMISKAKGCQKIISKIEDCEALENIDSIIEVSDGLMVARGDLGVETSFEQLPKIQKKLVLNSQKKGKIVIVATEMLESMINSIRPTRAEVSDVALAVRNKADATMLSGETANGNHPITAIRTMAKIAKIEEEFYTEKNLYKKDYDAFDDRSSLMKAACTLFEEIKGEALIVFSRYGKTARNATWMRLNGKVFVFTDNKELYTQLGLYWGVKSFLFEDEDISKIMLFLRDKKYLKSQDKVVVVSETVLRKEDNRSDSVRFLTIP